eukprot:comp20262_c0_seq1/m.40254 comp20262_c0_seq1/g.40254  ORF comp20262_c0_seq1/g.40254 comp20262_c0_seq1/m.40254 type:complete len:302 (-) comp20262_c0_seq1:220-1125(-)
MGQTVHEMIGRVLDLEQAEVALLQCVVIGPRGIAVGLAMPHRQLLHFKMRLAQLLAVLLGLLAHMGALHLEILDPLHKLGLVLAEHICAALHCCDFGHELLDLGLFELDAVVHGTQLVLQLLLDLELRVAPLDLVERLAVLAVAGVEHCQGVFERTHFLFGLADLRIELVSLALQLLLLLCGPDEEKRLRCTFGGIRVRRRRKLGHQQLVFFLDLVALHRAIGNLQMRAMALVVCDLEGALQHLAMYTDLVLALLHRHLELELAVLEPKHLVCLLIQGVAQLCNVELQNVVLHNHLVAQRL